MTSAKRYLASLATGAAVSVGVLAASLAIMPPAIPWTPLAVAVSAALAYPAQAVTHGVLNKLEQLNQEDQAARDSKGEDDWEYLHRLAYHEDLDDWPARVSQLETENKQVRAQLERTQVALDDARQGYRELLSVRQGHSRSKNEDQIWAEYEARAAQINANYKARVREIERQRR